MGEPSDPAAAVLPPPAHYQAATASVDGGEGSSDVPGAGQSAEGSVRVGGGTLRSCSCAAPAPLAVRQLARQPAVHPPPPSRLNLLGSGINFISFIFSPVFS